jgi:type IX secretion system PorP/SprF family membrane protein
MQYKRIHNLVVGINRLKIQILFCCYFLSMGCQLKAQPEVMNSQYMLNMININPAYAGNRVADNIMSLYRRQWLNIKGAPITYSLSWDKGLEGKGSSDINSGLYGDTSPAGYGMQLYKDQLGIETSQGVRFFYCYHIKFYHSSLTLGLSGGVMNYRAAYSEVSTPEPDRVFQEDISAVVPTAGIGALFETRQWYVGLSVPSLLHTKIMNNDMQITTGSDSHYFLTGGYVFDVSENLKLKPSLMLKAVKGEPLQYDVNLNGWIQSTLGIGFSYRHKDALVGMVQFRVTSQISIGYAYDYLTSNLKAYSSGSHELTLNFEFNMPRSSHIISPRYY